MTLVTRDSSFLAGERTNVDRVAGIGGRWVKSASRSCGHEQWRWRAGRIRAGALVVLLAVFAGCGAPAADEPDAQVDLTLAPSPPVVGQADVTVKLATASGDPIKGAEVRLEGNMNHAGMKPTFADLAEADGGAYQGSLEFTMGGDWYVLVTATTSDGARIERQIDVPGVKAP